MKKIDPYKDPLTFGKYKGSLYDDVASEDPNYIVWVAENVKSVKLPTDYVDAIRWDIMDDDHIYYDAWDWS